EFCRRRRVIDERVDRVARARREVGGALCHAAFPFPGGWDERSPRPVVPLIGAPPNSAVAKVGCAPITWGGLTASILVSRPDPREEVSNGYLVARLRDLAGAGSGRRSALRCQPRAGDRGCSPCGCEQRRREQSDPNGVGLAVDGQPR